RAGSRRCPADCGQRPRNGPDRRKQGASFLRSTKRPRRLKGLRGMRPELSQEQASPEALWTNLGLIGPLEARVSYGLPRSSTGISIDTRTLAEGDLFFAIHGDKSDGHDHVAAAFEKGAAAAVVSEARADSLAGLGPLYVVHEVLPALERLAVAARART